MWRNGYGSFHLQKDEHSFSRYSWLLVIPVLLITTWFGARRINPNGIWYDEWWTLYTSGASYFGQPLSPVEVWMRAATQEPMIPPGFFMLLSQWGQVAGWTEFAARVLPILLGVLAVARTYHLRTTLTRDPVGGLGAAVALGSSAWVIRYLVAMYGFSCYILLP